jgi:hypothetical protein
MSTTSPPVLEPYQSEERALFPEAPERDAVVDLRQQFLQGHVGLPPAVFRNDSLVCPRRIVDDRVHGLPV